MLNTKSVSNLVIPSGTYATVTLTLETSWQLLVWLSKKIISFRAMPVSFEIFLSWRLLFAL